MRIYFARHFTSQLRRLLKKYPQAKEDLLGELEYLNLDHETSIGQNVYKIRIKSSDMRKGKSGGFRAYVYVFRIRQLLVPLCMYAKSVSESLSDHDLKYHVDKIIEEVLGIA